MDVIEADIDELKPHPDNPRGHPPEQIKHLRASLDEYDFARNIVVASDDIILSGHGIVTAARQEGYETVPVARLPYDSDDPRAIKFMIQENSVQRMAEDDEAQTTALLANIADETGLQGTGYEDDALDELLGNLDEAEFTTDDEIHTDERLHNKWLIPIVVTTEEKALLDNAVTEHQKDWEQPHETMRRLVVESVDKDTRKSV